MSVTVMLVAPATTWLFVSTMPSEVSTMPVPAAAAFWAPSTVLMSTSAGSTLAATAATWLSVAPEPAEPVPEPAEPVPEPADPLPGCEPLPVPGLNGRYGALEPVCRIAASWCSDQPAANPPPAASTSAARPPPAAATRRPVRRGGRCGGQYCGGCS